MRKEEEFHTNLRFLSTLIEWERRYKGRSRLMGHSIFLILEILKVMVPIRTNVDYLALSKNLGVISVDEREKCME